MQLACSNCGARYRLPSDKVAGRDFRFRCKKCGTVVTVRASVGPEGAQAGGSGKQVASPIAPTAPKSPDRQRNWYAIQNGVQLGPVRLDELIQLIASGRVGARTFVWHQTLPEWQRVEDVPALAPTLSAREEGAKTPVPAKSAEPEAQSAAPVQTTADDDGASVEERPAKATRPTDDMSDSVLAAFAEVHETLTQMPAVPPSLTRQLEQADDPYALAAHASEKPHPKPEPALKLHPAEGRRDRSSALADELLREAVAQVSGVHPIDDVATASDDTKPKAEERVGFFNGEGDALLDNGESLGGGAIPAALQEAGAHPGNHADIFRAEERRRLVLRVLWGILLLVLVAATAFGVIWWLDQKNQNNSTNATGPNHTSSVGRLTTDLGQTPTDPPNGRHEPEGAKLRHTGWLGEGPDGTMKRSDEAAMDLAAVDLVEHNKKAAQRAPGHKQTASPAPAAGTETPSGIADEKGEVPVAVEGGGNSDRPNADKQLGQLFRLQMRSFAHCNKGGDEVRITISGTVATDGHVQDVVVDDEPHSLRSPRLRRCVRRIVDAWFLLPQDEPHSFKKTLVLPGE